MKHAISLRVKKPEVVVSVPFFEAPDGRALVGRTFFFFAANEQDGAVDLKKNPRPNLATPIWNRIKTEDIRIDFPPGGPFL